MIYVIDRSSLINLTRYYIFDKYDSKEEYEKFRKFFKNKFENEEIIIIDKVNNEGIEKIKKEFEINNNKIKSVDLTYLEEVKEDENNINKNHKYSEEEIESIKLKEEIEKADLSLIAYCKKLKDEDKEVCLITDERKINPKNKDAIKKYIKYYKKIPDICEDYKIICKNLPYLIFETYKNEVKFKLEINQKDNGELNEETKFQ